ncbi:hypothetical protein BDA99DRAFT_489641 [Phascolomyces articulosus]|uniref:Cyclin N-terminal domain-containing protein n=1 Tax=Phascolomyces articulosus TaxID=60185 RepID=A0AAD5K1B7_9FUNG|nr:hypothetical protein BDA99DRAFT_489641 [Phascolomyces articulosus]
MPITSTKQQLLLLQYCNHTHHLTDLVAIMVPSLWDRNRQKETHLMFKRFIYEMLNVMGISNHCVLIALYYIHRLFQLYPTMKTEPGFEVRTFTTALMLANKYHEDFTFRSKSWAEVSGIKLNELNLMEGEFMSAMRYQLHITKEDFSLWTDFCQSQIYSCRQHQYPPPPLSTITYPHKASPLTPIPTTTTTPLHKNTIHQLLSSSTTEHYLSLQGRQQQQQQQPPSLFPIMTTTTSKNHFIIPSSLPLSSTLIIKKRKEREDEPSLPATSFKRRAFRNTHQHHYLHLTTPNSITTATHHIPTSTTTTTTTPSYHHHHHHHRLAVPAYP